MSESMKPAATLDIRLDLCPMTFVKTKVALEEIGQGLILEVFVREGESLDNVARSCEEEGHAVEVRENCGAGEWRLLIRRGSV